MRIATVGNTIQTVNSPMYEYEYSWQCRSRTQQHTDSTKRSVPGWERTYNALVSTLLSQRISPPRQPGMNIYFLIKSVTVLQYQGWWFDIERVPNEYQETEECLNTNVTWTGEHPDPRISAWILTSESAIFHADVYLSKSVRGLAFATAPLTPLREHLIFSLFFSLIYIFFLVTVFTSISFLSMFHLYFSYHYIG